MSKYSTIAALLKLSQYRSQYLVGKALAEKFPTEAGWDLQMDALSDSFDMECLAEVAEDIRQVTQNPDDVDEVAAVVEAHYDRAIESIELLAETLGVDPRSLLHVLVSD